MGAANRFGSPFGFVECWNSLTLSTPANSQVFFKAPHPFAVYVHNRQTVTSDLQGVEYFTATADMCSSSTLEPYMSYTVYYVTAYWTLQSHYLQMLYLPEDHTGVNLAKVLTETLENLVLDSRKQSCLTTDNGSNTSSNGRIYHVLVTVSTW